MAERFMFVRTSQVEFSPINLQPLIMEATPLARGIASKPPLIAIGQGSSGRFFVGFDVELPGLPLNFSIHAEQFLVANLVQNEEPKLDALAISYDGSRYYAPCGQCSQFLQEIYEANKIKTLITGPTNLRFMPLEILLPQIVSPYNAFPKIIPDVLQQFNLRLSLIHKSPKPNRRHTLMSSKALVAAMRSYAPYTNAPAGVALMDGFGTLYGGSYLESIASTPSLGPVQAALINFVIETGGTNFKDIEEVVLVEKPRSRFSQVETAKMIIKKIANSECTFSVFHISDSADSSQV